MQHSPGTDYLTGLPVVQASSNLGNSIGPTWVATLAEIPGIGVAYESTNVTTTPVTKEIAAGLIAVTISYLDLGAAVGTELYVVFDALDAADALTKLGAEGRSIVRLGDTITFLFSPASRCRRIDYASDVAAETGASRAHLQGKVLA